MILALALLPLVQNPPPEEPEALLRGGTYTVEWGEPEPWPGDVEIEREWSTLSVTALFPELTWHRIRPLDDEVEVLRVRYRGESRSSSEPTVTIERGLWSRESHEKLLADLARIASVRLVPRTDLHMMWLRFDAEFWASVRAASGEDSLYEARWAGRPSSSNEIDRAKVEAASRRIASGIDALDFQPFDLTPEVRSCASLKFARDYARVPNFRSLRAHTLGLIAPLGDERAWSAIPERAPVRIRIVEEGDRPVEDARVEVLRRKALFWSTRVPTILRAGAPGLRFVLLEPGKYTLRVVAPGRPERRVPMRIEDASPREVVVRLPRP